MPYDPKNIEKKWQKYWHDHATYHTPNTSDKPKYYVLDMFPYPSGAGLHVGHPKGYTATDIVSRHRHANGYNVLHTMGWDAFGLPAENYAIKTGTHPKATTANNIGVFKQQLLSLGFSYDWDREIDTTDPAYYRWTQWIFLKLWEKGLAYEAELPVNWCPALKAVLANEEIVNGKSEIGGHPVERRNIRQWVLRITEYADKLLEELDNLDWPEGIKEMQRNWIGRSEGAEVDFRRDGGEETLRVFTTRIDTIYGVSFLVVAPDHAEVAKFITDERKAECEAYIASAKAKSDLERTELNKEKTGVFTGSFVINPFNKQKVPVWIADYVLGNYGTGAVMGVPAHDERDYAFAKKYDLGITDVVAQYIIMTGQETPRADVEQLDTRYCSTIVVEHHEGDRYAVMVWENNVVGLPGGGLETGETAEQAALREVAEEIGATNVASIRHIGSIVGHGYKARKNCNCLNPDNVFHVKLANLDGMISDGKENTHTYKIEWWTREEIFACGNFKVHHQRILEMALTKERTCFSGEGIAIHSGEFDLLQSAEAREKMIARAEAEGFGNRKIQYKLRDWIYSRQRYWGEPIPLVHISPEDYAKLPKFEIRNHRPLSAPLGRTSVFSGSGDGLGAMAAQLMGLIGKCIVFADDESGGTHLYKVRIASNDGASVDLEYLSKIERAIDSYVIADYTLPLLLPETPDYEPSDDGRSPLARIPEWVDVRIADNLYGKRETNTMPQWGASCWYYLRFMDPHNAEALADPDTMKYWGMVDEYVGGAEHAVLHLLYARFWHRFLHDIGVVPTKEPFYKLTNVGLILGSNNEKMSKSRGNVVNPNDVVDEYGADTLRLYEMFMGDFTDSAPWDTTKIIGMRRLLDRAYATIVDDKNKTTDDMKAMKLLHKTVKKVGEDIVAYKFNTAIAAINILLNEGCPTDADDAAEWKSVTTRLLHPFAPHIAEECWAHLGNTESVYHAAWPEYQEFMIVDDEVTIAIQVDGKLRTTFTCLNGVAKEEVLALAYDDDIVKKWTDGKEIAREIFVPNKLLNIVTKG